MKKLLYTFLAVSIIFSACKKEDEEPTNSLPSVIGTWNVNSMFYEITEGVYTSGSYPNGSFTVTDITSGISNYALENGQLTHEFSDNGFMIQIYNDDLSNNQADTSGSIFAIIGDSIFISSGQKGTISVTENTLLMDLFHIDLNNYPNFQSFQFNHTSERISSLD